MSARRCACRRGLSTSVAADCFKQTGAAARSKHQKGVIAVDAKFAANCPAQSEPSAEQVAALPGLVASGFAATIKAQERLLAQLLAALAAREELLRRVSTGALPADPALRRPAGPT